MIKNGALPHSMLFSGPVNSGKTDFAQKLMKALNCMNNSGGITPCNSCRNCRRISQMIFPDYLIVEPEGKTIKVARIRELKKALVLKPYEALKRLVLIKDSNLLGNESGNALLKILEEPPENTHFILTAVNYTDVLPTILSRCHQFRFFKKTRDEEFSSNELQDQKNSMEMEKITEIIEILMDKTRINSGTIIYLSEYICEKKEAIPSFYKTLLVFFRDILVYKISIKNIYLSEMEGLIKDGSLKLKEESLLKICDLILEVIEKLKGNLNSKLLVESSLLKIQAIINE